MNNGKVRIYDLSKELKLENKDILDICSELSIPYKSHSSTITEDQADSIRTVALNYVPTHKIKEKKHSHQEKKENNPLMSESSPNKNEQGKQEILAVHKHHRHSSDDSSNIDTEIESNQLNSIQTSDSNQKQIDNPLENPSNMSLKAPPARPSSQTPKSSEKTVKINKVKKPVINYEDKSLDKPVEKKKHSGNIKKPTLKSNLDQGKNKRKNKFKKSDQEKTATSSVKIAKPILADNSNSESTDKKVNVEINKGKPKFPKPPQRVKLAEEDLEIDDLKETVDDTDSVDDDDDEEGTLLLEKPKRFKNKPKRSLPKTPTKVWEDEEEAKKKNKLLAKEKRKSLKIDDDDEFDDLVSDELSGTETISLALARPDFVQNPKSPSASKDKVTKKPRPKLGKTEVKTSKKYSLEVSQVPDSIVLSESLSLREFAEKLNTPETEIIKLLFFKGISVNITQTLDLETATMVTRELNVRIEEKEEQAAATKTEMLAEDDLDNLQKRPPVVTIMGHVDHGKTTLLDSIRKTKVVQDEAGGITQHIGAYHVDVEHEGQTQQVVFLDTPGHEAFTAMRARGAKVTDIAVLVVAADDGVRPQTKEAISHAKAAKVPILVAINKIDKPDSNPDRVKNELMELGLVAEDWGGDTIMVPVSALKGDNLDTLLEMIVIVSEVEELSANPDRYAKGTVIEAHLDRARGPVTGLLVQNGTLRVGDVIVAGSVAGKVRAMIDDRGNKVEEATPSCAVEVLGLNQVPAAGDEFDVFESEKEAKAIAESRAEAQRDNRLQQALSSRRVTLSSLSEKAQQGELKELNLIVKADVQGSVEAILGSLKQLPQKEIQLRVLLSGAGEITETDVDLAAASGAVVIGFNTGFSLGARQEADKEGVDIREYSVIYKLLDDIQGAMEGLLDPEEVEESLGVAQIRAVFSVGRGVVAGCYVQSGKMVRNRYIRVVRKGEILYQGILDSLRRVKEDVKEVNAGYECGINSSQFNDWQEGDLVEAYEMVLKRRTLSQ